MITAVLVGLGHRGVGYATYVDSHPDELQIVGVAEPDEVRRSRYAERFDCLLYTSDAADE